MNIELIKDCILQYQSKSYSESNIHKIINSIKSLKQSSFCNDSSKEAYYLAVIESIVAGKTLYLAKNIGCFRFSSTNSDAHMEKYLER